MNTSVTESQWVMRVPRFISRLEPMGEETSSPSWANNELHVGGADPRDGAFLLLLRDEEF